MASDPSDFDAVAAAKELEDILGDTSAPTDEVTRLESELLEVNALLARREAELMAANARADHAHAEIEAASRRLATASQKELDQRTRKLLESFLPVVDDIARAIADTKQQASSLDVAEGLELVRRGLLTRLGSFGVVHVPALGEKFDPNRHEALALVPVKDPAQDGRV